MDAALDGAFGDAEALTDFLVGQLLKEPELHDFPELGRKAVERPKEAGPRLALLQQAVRAEQRVSRRPLERGFLGEEPLTLADLRPVVVDAVVAGDRVEPHGEVRPRVETVQLPVDPDDDLVGQFLGFLILAGKPVRQGEESPTMPADEVGPRCVGVQLAGPQRLYGRDVLRIAKVIGVGSPAGAGGNRGRGESRKMGQVRNLGVCPGKVVSTETAEAPG